MSRYPEQGAPAQALIDWMAEHYLLDGVPFPYLVPAPEMLPEESIRFFWLDHDWCERLTDGMLAAGSLGSLDHRLGNGALEALRAAMYTKLLRRVFGEGETWADPRTEWRRMPICGFLLRSEAVQRWPGLEVRAFSTWPGPNPGTVIGEVLPTLRRERLSATVLIALFRGEPQAVEIQEPNEGTRFGVEEGFVLNRWRTATGKETLADLAVPMRAGTRVIDILGLRDSVKKAAGTTAASSLIALNLQQKPYCHVFRNGAP